MYLNTENVSPTTGPISLIMVASIYYRYSVDCRVYRALNIYHSWSYQSHSNVFDSVLGYRNSDPEHITAILGQTVHFNCHANFPNDEVVPYVVQWEKRGSDTPIFIWWVLTCSGPGWPPGIKPLLSGQESNTTGVWPVQPPLSIIDKW